MAYLDEWHREARTVHWLTFLGEAFVVRVEKATGKAICSSGAVGGSRVRTSQLLQAGERSEEGNINRHTLTWGRSCWGGALFCSLADLELGKRSGSERALDDGPRAIVAAGGNVADRWHIERVLALGGVRGAW